MSHRMVDPNNFFISFAMHPLLTSAANKRKRMLGHQGVGRNKVSDSTLACCFKDTFFILEVVSMVIKLSGSYLQILSLK